jgi:hypothetical protein
MGRKQIMIFFVKFCEFVFACAVNFLYNHTLGDQFFFVTLTNCDLNVCSHIPYKPLQDCDYRQKKVA